MFKYFFILGREPELSITEIWQVAKDFNIKLEMIILDRQFLVVACDSLDASWWQKRLGGTIKIGEIIGSEQIEKEALVRKIINIIKPAKQIFFGFSWYLRPPRWINALGLEVKRHLKGRGKVRYVVAKNKILSSVVVQKNRLLPPVGYELVFFSYNNQVLFGRTLTVQPFEEFSYRDFNRPARDAYAGMLPPKLARMIVNISGIGDNLLDPFCGSGTILQEAVLLGVKNIVGSDINTGAVSSIKENIKWLKSKISNLDFTYNIFHSPIESLRNYISDKFNAIVCEPFLGPPLTGKENNQQLQAIHNSLIKDYSRWLSQLAAFLETNGRLVMIWPVLMPGTKPLYLNLDNSVKQAGFKIINVVPSFIPKDWLSNRGTLLYYRPNQRIAREIIVLSK